MTWMLATFSSTLGFASSIIGIAALAGAVLMYSRTQAALTLQGATIAALEAGLAEARTQHVTCETNLGILKLAHAQDIAALTAKIEMVERESVDRFVKAVQVVVRTELDRTP